MNRRNHSFFANAIVLVAAWLLVVAPLRADELPLITAKTAGIHVGKLAAVEFTVIETKFAQRRQMHFLSGLPNFRSEENVPVAIREAEFAEFRKAGIDDLNAKYLGRRVRARGTVVQDEGQWLVMVQSPSEIELLQERATPDAPSELVVIDDQGVRTVLPLPLGEGLPRTKVAVEHEGQQETYEGVLLASLLERAKVPLGAGARGVMMSRYLLISAQDGYTALYSVAEVDPFFVEHPALLADRLNGQPLPQTAGPLRVVVPRDKHRRRWVGQVTRIEVRNALESPAAAR